MKAILAVAVLAMAAFAGVMIVGDDADAADEVVKYKVSYVYGDNIMVETVTAEADGSALIDLKAFDAVFGDSAPEGYKFSKWQVGFSLYEPGTEVLTITGDITVTPIFAADEPIIKLVYGDVSEEFVVTGVTATGGTTTYPLTLADLQKFAKTIGAKVINTETLKELDPAASETILVPEKAALYISGFEFKGFFATGADKATGIDKILGADKAVTAFTAVFEPVYNVSFVVEGATVLKINSDKISLNDERTVPIAPIKDNYIFMGWYDAAGEKIIGYSIDKDEYTYAAGDDFKFTEDIVLYAKFVPVTFTVTFVYGEDKAVFTTETVKYGDLAIEPKGLPEGYKGWDWNFGTKIIADTEIVAIVADPVTIYTVTFEIDGKTPVTQRSDSMVLPDTKIEGKVFQGWVVKGGVEYVNPMTYEIINDMTFVAVYKTAVATAYTVTFEIDGKAPVTQRADSLAIPDVTREGFNFQGWVVKGGVEYVNPMSYDITEDITFVAVYKEADPPAGPGFFETTEGKCVAVLIAVVIIAFVYAVATNMFGLKDALTSVKITRVKK